MAFADVDEWAGGGNLIYKIMAKSRFQSLLNKSIAAAISAIEIYNKPDFKYREETFSILMINAWELLLKAKILKDNKNSLKSIQVPEKTKNKQGELLKRFYPKLNRAGNPMTIEIKGAIEKLKLPDRLKENLYLLIEIRDNAIHFLNKEPFFQKKILEIGTANLKSYLKVFNDWFDHDLSQYNFYLMPISFFHTFEIESFSINKKPKQLQNLIIHILQKEIEHPSDLKNDHNISLKLETKFAKSTNPEALQVEYSKDAKLKVKIDTEEKFKNKYQLDFQSLIEKMSEKYKNFSRNPEFFKLKKELEKNEKYCGERFLDMIKRTGTSKKYYSTEIFKKFDEHYNKSSIK